MEDDNKPVETLEDVDKQTPVTPVVDDKQPAPVETNTEPTPTVPDWRDELSKLSPKEFREAIRKHDKLAGVYGGMLSIDVEAKIAAERKRNEEENKRLVREQTEEELLKFHEDNADYMKQNYPKAFERIQEIKKEREGRVLGDTQKKTITAVGDAIAQALGQIPEFRDMLANQDEALALRNKLAGKSDVETPGIVQEHAIAYIANKRAEKLLAEWRDKELAKEREAVRQEEAAKLLAKTPAPEPKPGVTPGKAKVDVGGMSDEEFDRWYEKNVKGS